MLVYYTICLDYFVNELCIHKPPVDSTLNIQTNAETKICALSNFPARKNHYKKIFRVFFHLICRAMRTFLTCLVTVTLVFTKHYFSSVRPHSYGTYTICCEQNSMIRRRKKMWWSRPRVRNVVYYYHKSIDMCRFGFSNTQFQTLSTISLFVQSN